MATPIRIVYSRGDRAALACLGASSVLVNLVLLAWSGIRHGADTSRYLASANDLLAGGWFRGAGGHLYIGYNAVVAACEAIGAGEAGVMAVQIAAASLATIALYDLGRQLRGRLAGVLAGVFLIVDYDIARWHLYVLTDSLYISLVIVSTWFVHRAVGRGIWGYLEATGVFVLTALIRPNGWILAPLAAIYWLACSELRTRYKYATAVGVVLVFLGGVVTALLIARGASPPSPPGAPPRINSEHLPFQETPLERSVNPRRMWGRLMMELGHVRPPFSARHNTMIIAMLAVVYPLAVWGFIRTLGQPLSRLIAGVIGAHLLVIAVTFSDTDGRYLLYTFPLIVVFAACGAVALRETAARRSA